MTNKKERITCKEYCPVWNDEDRDCDIYGEHHPSPRHCPHFKKHHPEIFTKEGDSE